MSVPNLVVVMGPTASGKSEVAEAIANFHNAPIINGDAFQIYRGMDIGTAKPKDKSNYHLLDIRNPNEDFGVGEYVILASELLHEFYNQNRSVVICGGTGLYIRALTEEYRDLFPSPSAELRLKVAEMNLDEAVDSLTKLDPNGSSNMDLKNEIRVKRALEKKMENRIPIQFSVPPFMIKKIAIIPPSQLSQVKIKQRTQEMFQNGWVAEVKDLLNKGYGLGNPGFRALGYEAIAEYLQEKGNEMDLVERIENDTVRYAKRQRTWLRAEPNLVVFDGVSEALEAITP